ncbi:MAG: hypothetical protein F4203_08725 [Rhodobacteraceae bacterium]|nr:hypothetical protein [Paracoccaceae bacterium]
MNLKQSQISQRPIRKEARLFCEVCLSIYYYWVTYNNIFEKISSLLQSERNISAWEFKNTPIGSTLSIIDRTLGNQVILEITKLHDPARMKNNENVCIDLFVSHVEWSDREMSKIQNLKEKLEENFNFIKPARNKILAHNDREAFNN